MAYRSAYDGTFENSDKSENSVEVKNEHNTKNLQTDVRDRDNQRAENIDSVIAVGDRVTVEDCPGHWLWAQPFEVETIEGDLAKLEMVSQRDLVGFQRRLLRKSILSQNAPYKERLTNPLG